MLLWMSTIAGAQVVGGALPDLNAQTFRPSIDGDRMLWLDDAGSRPDLRFTGRALLQYLDDPLVYTDAEGVESSLVSSVVQLDVLAGYTLGPLRLGVDLPVYLFAGSDVAEGEGGVGDLALDGKFTVLDGDDAPIDIGVDVRVALPTATVETALGSPVTTWEIAGLLSREFGPVLLATNLGVRAGPSASLENIVFKDFFVARLGGSYAFVDDAGASLELSSQLPFAVGNADPSVAPVLSNTAGWPIEALLSGYGYPATDVDVVLRAGVGTGLTQGIGSPDFRLFLGLGYEPRGERAPVDTDADGIVDKLDVCPAEAEDMDDFADEDGCPDLDNDEDGVLDVADACVNEAEDADGYRDEDGCPEAVTMVSVTVIDAATDDSIGVAKVSATCAGERVAGTTPFERELPAGDCKLAANAAGYTRNETEFTVVDGAPMMATIALEPKLNAKVIVTRDRVELRETVRFETNKALIKEVSYGLLDEAVQILRDYPEIVHLRIEGHTDARGNESYNQDLSEQRAATVLTYFTSKGIAASRLSSVGFGESKPLDAASNQAAWAKNRRVDFFIEEWDASRGD